MKGSELPHSIITPHVITILATYRCTASCQDCCFDSNPTLRKRLSLDEIIEIIEQASSYKTLEMVVFSGGECFLLGDDLTKAIAYSSSKGLKTRCVTNGYWAKSIDAGRRRLQQLVDAGLNELNVSTGDFHQEYVSEDTVVNALTLGLELSITTLAVIEATKESKVKMKDFIKREEILSLHKQHGTDQFQVIESPWMPMDVEGVIEQNQEKVLSRNTLHLKSGCKSVFTTLSISPYKKLGLCCGLTREKIPELNISLRDNSVSSILEKAGQDFMKIWLFVDGPEKILAWVASKRTNIEWENLYSHRCHVCWAIFERPEVRQVILEHYKERVDEILLRFKGFLYQQEMLEHEVYG